MTVDLVDEDGTYLDRANAHSVHVNNVAPTIAISGAASVNEGSSYSLTSGRSHRPGYGHGLQLRRPLGRRQRRHLRHNGAKSHTYADGASDHAITVDLVDEDGTFLDRANLLSVHVNNVAPSIAISGNANVNEGSPYSLTLGAVTDPGQDTVTSWIVHWGDGNSNTYSADGDQDAHLRGRARRPQRDRRPGRRGRHLPRSGQRALRCTWSTSLRPRT